MLPAATVRALTTPAFTAAEFAPTQWDSAEDKAKFANALMKFIAHEFPRQSFTKPFYRRLSSTFGHIAEAFVASQRTREWRPIRSYASSAPGCWNTTAWRTQR